MRIDHKAQKGNPFRHRPHLGALPRGSSAASRARRSTRARFQAQSCRLSSPNKQQIVHVAHVAAAAQLALDKMVKGIEVAVGPELRGQVADRQAARPAGGQEIVARETRPSRTPRSARPRRSPGCGRPATSRPDRASCGPGAAQERVVDGREKLATSQGKHVAVAPGKMTAPGPARGACPCPPVGIASRR